MLRPERIDEWAELTGPDFEKMDRERTVVLVTFSPLEVHGPHLPVITDNLEAEELAYAVAAKLEGMHDDIRFVHLPPMYVAADVLPHPGSVKFQSRTIIKVAEDLGRSLAAQGFKHIWVSSFHGGPRHFVPLEVAATTTNRKYGTKMISVFSLLINRLSGGRTDVPELFAHIDGVNPEELKGDAHAGAVETSLMLHLMGDHVKPEFAELEANTVNIKLERDGKEPLQSEGRPSIKELFRGFKEKLKYYETETYSGKPALADPVIGEQMLDTLAGLAADTLSEVWTGQLDPEDCHSPVWPFRWIFISAKFSWLFEKAMKYRNQVW